MKDQLKIIGKSERRVDAWGKVTGKAKYADDYNAPHQLVGKVLRSKYPHAKIVRIDTSKAEQLAGVESVLTVKDIPGAKVFGVVVKNQAILAEDRVRYLGDGVALVAAGSSEIAARAISLIEVDYEPLPVVSDPEEALKPGSPILHDEKNEFVHHHVRKGDVAKGFAESDVIIERKFKTQFIEHSYIEPEAVLAEPSEQNGIKITGCVQNLFSTRRSVASMLNLDLGKVQIVQSTLGGSFGGKDEAMTLISCRAALLAMKTGKPVKMINTREESML
ncbi:MAG: xanthine dehydrogenase, partial [Ignavibacteriae bacterium]